MDFSSELLPLGVIIVHYKHELEDSLSYAGVIFVLGIVPGLLLAGSKESENYKLKK